MVCSFCGSTVSDPKLPFCATCGRPVSATSAPAPAPTLAKPAVPTTAPVAISSSNPIPVAETPITVPSGVGGWLLLLCFLLTIWIPVWTVFNLFRSIHYAWSPMTAVLFVADMVLAAVGAYAGWMLWKRQAKGLAWAKGVLLAHAVFPFVSILNIVISYGASPLSAGLLIRLLYPVAIALAFYLYLGRSARVRATYA